MRFPSVSLILIPFLATGCASQQALDAQSGDIGQQLSVLRQQQANLSAAQQKMDARLTAIESANTRLQSRFDQAIPALQHEMGSMDARLSALSAQVENSSAASIKAQETADDAIKIARDSRSVAGKVVESLTLNEDMVSYNYEQPELTASGKAALDDLIAKTRPLMPHAFIEIIGFTDNTSLTSQNRKIALERAESVRRYLRETGGFPLHRMSSISYGDLQPVVSGDTFQARSQNRRVVVQVLK